MTDLKRVMESYLGAAKDSFALASVLAGQEQMSDRDFLELMARSDAILDHDGETCGMCHKMILDSIVAREMLQAEDYKDAMKRWSEESQRRWRESKFFKLWQEEIAAHRDPHQAFADRGWEP